MPQQYIAQIKIPNNDTPYRIKDTTHPEIKFYYPTGTAAVTTSPYYCARYDVTDTEVTAYTDGMMVWFEVPVAGNGTYGTGLQINSLGYKPIVCDTNTPIGNRYSVGSRIWCIYNSTQTATLYINSATATTVTGCWQVMADKHCPIVLNATVSDNTVTSLGGVSASELYAMYSSGQSPIYANVNGDLYRLTSCTSQTILGTTTYAGQFQYLTGAIEPYIKSFAFLSAQGSATVFSCQIKTTELTEIFWCDFDTPYVTITNAISNNQLPVLKYNGSFYIYSYIDDGYVFIHASPYAIAGWECFSDDSWEETSAYIEFVTSISSSSTDDEVPTALAVYNALQNAGTSVVIREWSDS